jgi:hypothetical protein
MRGLEIEIVSRAVGEFDEARSPRTAKNADDQGEFGNSSSRGRCGQDQALPQNAFAREGGQSIATNARNSAEKPVAMGPRLRGEDENEKGIGRIRRYKFARRARRRARVAGGA